MEGRPPAPPLPSAADGWHPRRVPWLERDQARVHYEVSGSGPALVLGHGLLFDARMWAEVQPKLEPYFRVLTVEARGHGRSTNSGRFTLWDLAQNWRAILDAEGVEHAALVGFSMGGMTAIRMALAAPERVTSLVLIDTAAHPEPWSIRARNRVMSESGRMTGNIRPFLPIIERLVFSPTTRRERPELVREGMVPVRELDARAAYGAIRATFERERLVERLRDLRIPTRVIVGEDDIQTPAVWSKSLAANIPGAELVFVPRAGHMTPIEAPELVAGHILEHLSHGRGASTP